MLNLKHQSDFSLFRGFSVRLYDEKKRTCLNGNLCVIQHCITAIEITNSLALENQAIKCELNLFSCFLKDECFF